MRIGFLPWAAALTVLCSCYRAQPGGLATMLDSTTAVSVAVPIDTGTVVDTTTMSARATCPNGRAGRDDWGRVTLLIKPDSAPPADLQASLRIDGALYGVHLAHGNVNRSSIRIKPFEPMLFVWRPDAYEVRVQLLGYFTERRRVVVGCNTAQTVVVEMRKGR